jgi:hypothetical protein
VAIALDAPFYFVGAGMRRGAIRPDRWLPRLGPDAPWASPAPIAVR